MPTADLKRARGQGDNKFAFGTASVSPGDTIDTGLAGLDSVVLDVEDASGTAIANPGTISGGTITVQHNLSGSQTVHYQAIGTGN